MTMIATRDHAFNTGNSIATDRVAWIDASKGLAIILMVFCHVLGGAVERGVLDAEEEAITHYNALIKMTDGTERELHNPADYPDPVHIESMQEPWIKATIMTPDEHLGSVLTLCQERRGQQIELTYAGTRAMAVYRLPLNEVVFDFYDRLKSVTRGYASFDYEMVGYEEGELVKLTILVNAEPVDALSIIVHKNQAESRGRALCERLKDLIPRQLFKIAIQAAIGGRIIARETISALRKDVLAKCYGGDISRKKKLLEKQKKGKKRMRQVGDVEIPQSAFIAALKMDSR